MPDGFIYLRATPQTCMSRLKHRARDEETAVDISYLEDLHQRHDAWLYQMHENADPGLAPLLKQVRPSPGLTAAFGTAMRGAVATAWI